ncbi:hypothetical protein C8R43DRAFT_1112237 [Mycena crocata]|nr:hypothetical protein C8R43DRAFT_1112237 [Mycena crocata]
MDLGQLFALLKHDAMAISSYRLNASSYASATDSSFSASDMSRNYPYPPTGYSGSNASPPPGSSYSPSYEQSVGGRPYYPSTSSARVGHHSGQYYPPIAPAPPASDRYSSSSNYRPSRGSQEYSSPSSYPYNANNRGYPSNPPASGSYPYNPRTISPLDGAPAPYRSSNQPPPRGFIPTPSEAAYANPTRPPRPSSAMHHTSRGSGGYVVPPPSSRPSHTSRPGRSISPTHTSNASGERFACEVCGKDFSRAHDRKRHHETQHAATPVTHKCIYCEKDFSRADSLKRHIQNGCDEAPQ